MSGGPRQTGTVPKTKQNSRPRREHPVNHIPNNLDWQEPYSAQRVRKESNTSASRMSDPGDEYDENPWLGLPLSTRSEGDEMRWQNVKSSNLSPERGGSLTNVDSVLGSSRSSLHRQENSVLEEPMTSSKEAEKIRLKQKIELSQRKIDELQQQQAAYLSLRNKAIQQVKPVQVEEIHQNQSLASLRNKAIQQVKPVQPCDIDQMNNIERRLHNIQEFTNLIEAIDRDERVSANVEGRDCEMEQQLRRKLQQLIEKKARMDNLLAYFESSKLGLDGARSVSSEEGESSGSYLRTHILENAEMAKRDSKQDNREQHSYGSRETRLEDLRVKLDQLQGWMSRMENLNGPKSTPRMNGDGASAQLLDTPQIQSKLLPATEKGNHTKKLGLEHNMKRTKSNSSSRQSNGLTLSQSNVECWSLPTQRSTPLNSVNFSSDEGEYDESPVKLCPPHLPNSYNQQQFTKTNSFGVGVENSLSTPAQFPDKCPINSGRSECEGALEANRQTRAPHQPVASQPPPPQDPTTLMALHLSQLQLQVEQMQAMYQGLIEKQSPYQQPQQPPQWVPPNPNPPPLGFMQYMTPSSQWHQYQLLITSLNQCCQLIWHQQREIAGLRQALNMLQEEERLYKCEEGCQGYGHNLNAGLLWQPPLNNQVPPGNRANNYWDNFRSYSRQNLLSARNKSNEGHRTSVQTENLRRVENSSLSNSRPGQSRNGENFCESNRCAARDSMNKIKHEHGNDTFSLEQSVYSELETVIGEPERSPDLLLQLLSQLKSLKSQQAHIKQDGCFDEAGVPRREADCEGAAAPVLGHSPKPPQPEEKMSDGGILDEVGRLLGGGCGDEICSPELLQRLVDLTATALHLSPHHDTLSKLEASLLKFQGARLNQVAEELLCVIANTLSLHYPVELTIQEDCDEEGAVGGIILPGAPGPSSIHHHHHTQTSSPQSIETELAEADQRSSSDNILVLGGPDNVPVETQEHSAMRDCATSADPTQPES